MLPENSLMVGWESAGNRLEWRSPRTEWLGSMLSIFLDAPMPEQA
jgi:hypothetical protein